jgi:hypothetical protein
MLICFLDLTAGSERYLVGYEMVVVPLEVSSNWLPSLRIREVKTCITGIEAHLKEGRCKKVTEQRHSKRKQKANHALQQTYTSNSRSIDRAKEAGCDASMIHT